MRGEDLQQPELFSYESLEERVPANHPLRPIRTMVDEALKALDGRFDEIYGEDGRKSIPPERLLRALLLQMFYTIRSERMLMEQLEYNLLFRWFVGLSANEPVWHPTVFTKNRDRLLEGAVAEEFFSLIVNQARQKRLLSDEHFTVDGTLVEAWAGQKSFQAKKQVVTDHLPPSQSGGSNPTVDFHKQKRSNQTHQSTTDPSARLFKKTRGAEARLGYLGHVVTENRNGLVVDTRLTMASGTAERDAAVEMLEHKPAWRRVTLGGDRGYDTRGFVESLRSLRVTPHVAENTANRRSAIDGRTTQHEGYTVSQRKRKRVEEVFGWLKTVALQRKTRFRGPDRVGWMFTLAAAAYNLIRMRNLAQAV
ncbi:MAG TPA: IS5 family transposase [Candidatus Acidoferrum sp.]|nr:IS5 family transposase [Candidatus Acidoferrum sp.]